MSEVEFYSHQLLASLVSEGKPEELSRQGHTLTRAAQVLAAVGQEIAARMSRVAWEGEAAEAFRAWGRHFGEQSSVLGEYAYTVGEAMLRAGTALREAQSAMPPSPPSVLSTEASATPLDEITAETDRQEAIRVAERLVSTYQVAADLMQSAEEPRFFQLPDVHWGFKPGQEAELVPGTQLAPISEQTPNGTANRPNYPSAPTTSPPLDDRSSSEVGQGSLQPGDQRPSVQEPTSRQPQLDDGRVGTSLDAVAAPPTSTTTGPVGGNPSLLPSTGSDGNTAPGMLTQLPPSSPIGGPPRMPPASVPPGRGVPPAVQPSVRPPVAPPAGGSAAEGQGPTVGRPPVTGGTPGSRSSVPSGSPVQGQLAGRPPITGVPRTPAERERPAWRPQERGGIVGGIPRSTGTGPSRTMRPAQNPVIGAPNPQRGRAERSPQREKRWSYGGLTIGRRTTPESDEARRVAYGRAVADGTPRRNAPEASRVLPPAEPVTGRPSRGTNTKKRRKRRDDETGRS